MTLIYPSAPFAYAYTLRPRNACRAGVGTITRGTCATAPRLSP